MPCHFLSRHRGHCLGILFGIATLGLATARCGAEAPAAAADPNDMSGHLSLDEARRLALARNWDLLAAKSDVDIAFAQRLIAREVPNPTLSLSTAKISVDHHPNSTVMGNGLWERSYDAIAAITQLLEIGGKRGSRQVSATAGWRTAKARLADACRLLDQGIAGAYVAALQAGENARILRESAASLRQEARIAAIRFKAGEIAESDQKQIEIAADRLELDAQSADAAAAAARINVEVLLGARHPEGQWIATDTLESLARTPVPHDRSAPAFPRPDVAEAEAAKAKADADLKLQRAYRVPDPTLQFQYERNPADLPNTIGFGFSLPLPLWNHNRGAIEAAKAAAEQAHVQLEKARSQAEADIINARIAYDEAATRLDRYAKEIRPRARAITETISFAYQKGGASLVDLLSAQRNDNEVRLATAQAQADTATAAAGVIAVMNLHAFQADLP